MSNAYISFDDLASELLENIMGASPDVKTLLALASTSKRMRDVYQSHKLIYLADTVDRQYGPLHDAIQLLTHNESQLPHVTRLVSISVPLIKEVVRVGRVATRWVDIYPIKHWHDNYEDRRLLTSTECRALRQAIYRLWLYDIAFHTSLFPRTARMTPKDLEVRAKLLHNFNNFELAHMSDVQSVLRAVVKTSICPSNGTIQRKFKQRFPDSQYQLIFNMQPNPNILAPPKQSVRHYKNYHKYAPTQVHEPGCEGWGDDSDNYFVVEDMLKLNPEQILWLKDNAPGKFQVQEYVDELGSWFENNGQTFGQTLEHVLEARMVDLDEFEDCLASDELGIASLGRSDLHC